MMSSARIATASAAELRPETASPARAAREFESLFLAELLKRAQRPMFENSLLSGGAAGEQYRDWFADEIAGRMAAAGGLGLARAIAGRGAAQAERGE
jgi:Rod binding domain-containing protein